MPADRPTLGPAWRGTPARYALETAADSRGIRTLLGRLRGKQSHAEKVNGHERDLNSLVGQLTAQEDLHLLDFEKVFAPDGGARKSEYATENRTHLTAAGYAALTAYAIAEFEKRPSTVCPAP